MTPLERYQHDLDDGVLQPDVAQAEAVQQLQRLYEELVRSAPAEGGSLLKKLFRKQEAAVVPKGLYFWGGVGRGKTYLMDAFYDSLPFEQKMRVHFHRFMQMAHRRLKDLAGVKNPLQILARQMKADNRVICFDEFFVSDITDAMILGGLMEELFNQGVTLVATSNIVPDDLYKDGLQRQRFLPVIDLLKQHTRILNVDGGIDYRLRVLEQAEIYHYPLDREADKSLMSSFMQLAPDLETITEGEQIEIEGRKLTTVRCDDDIVWFEFAELCDGPRSQNDYIEIARMYHAVLVSNVPVLGGNKDDQARRFINMVDEFYDRKVKLIISAAAPIVELYSGGRLGFEFERTQSRLLEMQSHDYLARAHKA
ncbi:MAG: cell division protein ZapE [Pseudomonadales bacterium]